MPVVEEDLVGVGAVVQEMGVNTEGNMPIIAAEEEKRICVARSGAITPLVVAIFSEELAYVLDADCRTLAAVVAPDPPEMTTG